jgi:hypothetical protein
MKRHAMNPDYCFYYWTIVTAVGDSQAKKILNLAFGFSQVKQD